MILTYDHGYVTDYPWIDLINVWARVYVLFILFHFSGFGSVLHYFKTSKWNFVGEVFRVSHVDY